MDTLDIISWLENKYDAELDKKAETDNKFFALGLYSRLQLIDELLEAIGPKSTYQ